MSQSPRQHARIEYLPQPEPQVHPPHPQACQLRHAADNGVIDQASILHAQLDFCTKILHKETHSHNHTRADLDRFRTQALQWERLHAQQESKAQQLSAANNTLQAKVQDGEIRRVGMERNLVFLRAEYERLAGIIRENGQSSNKTMVENNPKALGVEGLTLGTGSEHPPIGL
jgi:hypothetical protein